MNYYYYEYDVSLFHGEKFMGILTAANYYEAIDALNEQYGKLKEICLKELDTPACLILSTEAIAEIRENEGKEA